jgi:hypothetical protein
MKSAYGSGAKRGGDKRIGKKITTDPGDCEAALVPNQISV